MLIHKKWLERFIDTVKLLADFGPQMFGLWLEKLSNGSLKCFGTMLEICNDDTARLNRNICQSCAE